jgi:hypothetical protein
LRTGRTIGPFLRRPPGRGSRLTVGVFVVLICLHTAARAGAASGASERAGVQSPVDQRVPGVLVGLVAAAALVILAAVISVVRRHHAPSADREAAAGGVAAHVPAAVRDPTTNTSTRVSVMRTVAVAVIGAGFTVIALGAARQIMHLIWRPSEVGRMLDAGVSLAVDFPARFAVLVLLSVVLMLTAEYHPRALLYGSIMFWIAIGWVGVGAYALVLLDVGSRPALAVLLAVGAAVTVAMLVRGSLRAWPREQPMGDAPAAGRGRAVLPTLVGVVGGVLAVRASIEAVTQWDAVVTNVSFARDWLQSLPGLPHAAGPSAGAEVSYNQPALFPAIGVAVSAPLHLGVEGVVRLISPLAALTVLAALRVIGARSGLAAWVPSMFLLGSTLFVAYAQWPTVYLLVLVFLVLAAGRLVADRRLLPATAALIGLAAGAALIGVFLAAILLGAYLGCTAGVRAGRPRVAAFRRNAAVIALLTGPLALVVVASLDHTRSLLFPWVTWPHGRHLLPQPEWASSRHVLVANLYGHPNVDLGDYLRASRGILTSGALAPGSLVAGFVVVAACAAATAVGRPVVRFGVALAFVASLLLVSLQLVRLGNFLPVTVLAAMAIGMVVSSEVVGHQPVARVAAAIAVAACLASGVAYAVAGPGDRTSTASTDYRRNRVSAFETARAAADSRRRLDAVFGGDARAWRDIAALDAAGIAVGSFDVRHYYSEYRAPLQLDGLAGTSVGGASAVAVAHGLTSRGIDAVFVPSTFWEPGAGRSPLADLSPVALWVGAPSLRAVRVYLPDEDVSYPSVLYGVGTEGARRVGALLRTPAFSVAGPLSSRTIARPGGFAFAGVLGRGLHWRVAAPVTEANGPALRFSTGDLNVAPEVTVQEPRTPTLFEPATFVDCTHVPGWARRSTLDVFVPGSTLGFATLDVAGRPGARGSFSGQVVRTSGPVLVHACGDPAGVPGGVFPSGVASERIVVDLSRARKRPALSFDYRDDGRGQISFTTRDEFHQRWLPGLPVLERCGSGRWLHARLPLPWPTPLRTRVDIQPIVDGRNLTVRRLSLVADAPPSVPRC